MPAVPPPPGRPLALDLAAYRARLSDAAFWAPYVAVVLRRHGLPGGTPRSGTPGSFPTFLVGDYAVKLFGEHFAGATDYTTECAVYEVLGRAPPLPVPALVGTGYLFEGAAPDVWPWPYLVTTRIGGDPWRTAAAAPDARRALARQLGAVMRAVHELPHPPALVRERDPFAELRATCAERHRAWGTLPPHLVAQIDGYLAEPSPERRLVHADLHADHLFTDGARITGIIDWADALVCDPYYELPALHLGTFGASPALLREFLAGYGWAVGPDFQRRAMSMALLHQFAVLEALAPTGLAGAATLEDLAVRVWQL
jgi:aminoglycoside phosphotransferase (APT) family kinase protein